MRTVCKVAITASPLFLFILFASPVQAEPYGWSPNVDNSWQGPPSHEGNPADKPGKAPILFLVNQQAGGGGQGFGGGAGPGPGAVRLKWHKVPGATGYHIYYGLSPRNYIHSVPDLGDIDSFTVNHLANRTYYVAIQARRGYAVSDLSNEFVIRPRRSGSVGANSVLGIGDVQTAQPVTRKKAYIPPAYEESEVQGVVDEPATAPVYEAPAYEQPVYQMPTAAPTRIQPTPAPAKKGFWQQILNALGLGR